MTNPNPDEITCHDHFVPDSETEEELTPEDDEDR